MLAEALVELREEDACGVVAVGGGEYEHGVVVGFLALHGLIAGSADEVGEGVVVDGVEGDAPVVGIGGGDGAFGVAGVFEDVSDGEAVDPLFGDEAFGGGVEVGGIEEDGHEAVACGGPFVDEVGSWELGGDGGEEFFGMGGELGWGFEVAEAEGAEGDWGAADAEGVFIGDGDEGVGEAVSREGEEGVGEAGAGEDVGIGEADGGDDGVEDEGEAVEEVGSRGGADEEGAARAKEGPEAPGEGEGPAEEAEVPGGLGGEALGAIGGESGVGLRGEGAWRVADADVGVALEPGGEFGVDVALGGGGRFRGQIVGGDEEGECDFVSGIGEDEGIGGEALEGPAGGSGEGEEADVEGGGR